MKKRIHEAVKALHRADELLAAWLMDNTEDVFEEIEEVDDARVIINEVIEDLKKEQA